MKYQRILTGSHSFRVKIHTNITKNSMLRKIGGEINVVDSKLKLILNYSLFEADLVTNKYVAVWLKAEVSL